MSKYSVIGVVLIFIDTILICGRFSYGALWVNYIGKSSAENLFLNLFTLFIYAAIFAVGLVCIRKGKSKK